MWHKIKYQKNIKKYQKKLLTNLNHSDNIFKSLVKKTSYKTRNLKTKKKVLDKQL